MVAQVNLVIRLQAGWLGFSSWQGQWWDFSLHHHVQTGSKPI